MSFSSGESAPKSFSFFQNFQKTLPKAKTKKQQDTVTKIVALYKEAKLKEAKELMKIFLSSSSPKEQREFFLTCAKSGLLAQALLDLPRALKTLDLSGCSELSDKTLLALVGRLPYLKHINLSNCSSLSDEAIGNFVSHIPGLKHLDLTGCHGVSSVTLEALAETPASLTHLILDGCYDIQDKDLSFLAEELVSLQKVSLFACDQVSHLGISAVENAFPGIELIT